MMAPERRRILCLLPTLGGGGAERAFVTLLRHFDRSRFEPHLGLLAAVGPYLKDVPEDVPIHDLNLFRVRRSPLALIRLVRQLRPHAVLAAPREVNMALGFVRPWLPRDLKLLVREENSVTAELAEKSSHPRVWRWLYRRFYPRADTIICVADYILNDLAEHFAIPRHKMVRIYNPVDIDGVRRLAAQLGNPYAGAGPHLVAAGRLTWQKGFDVLLDAMALVRETLPRVRLTLLGAGPLEPELKAQSERLGLAEAIHFAGFQSNPYPYFKHADAFVLPSRYEGMPLVLLEALALGTFVVAADCPGGVGEILSGSGAGVLVPHSDARLLAQAILAACRPDGKRSSHAEHLEALLDNFRVERVMSAYENLLAI